MFLACSYFNKIVLNHCHNANNDHTKPFAEKSDFDIYRPLKRTNTCFTPDAEFTAMQNPAHCYDSCPSFRPAVLCIE